MIKLLIVVFSFFLIVGVGHADKVTYGSDGTTNGTVDSKGTFTSTEGGGSSAAETKARQNDSGMYADQNKANAASKQMANERQTEATTKQQQEAEEAKLANELNAEGDANRKSTEVSTEKKLEQSNNILGLSDSDLRTGNVNQNTIATVIVNIINLLLGVAGTVAIFSLIYHAVQMQINSGITGDSSGVDKAKKGMIGALIGFVIAISAWFLVARVVELLGAAS